METYTPSATRIARPGALTGSGPRGHPRPGRRRPRLRGQDGRADVVALGVVDAVLGQQAQRRLVAHVLGDGAPPEAPREGHDGAHEVLVDGAAGQVADELAVDLQVGRGQVLQVVEGAEAGAEVVER